MLHWTTLRSTSALSDSHDSDKLAPTTLPCSLSQLWHAHFHNWYVCSQNSNIFTFKALTSLVSLLWHASATTLVSVRNTRVFRTALTTLMEPRTLWRRIARYPSPRRRVALHTYLLYFLVTYTHHQNDTCVTLFAVAAVMLKLFFLRPPLLWKCCWCTWKS